MIGVSPVSLLVAAAAVVVVAALIVLLAVRARSRQDAGRLPPGPTGPSSPTAIICPFCKREYDPPETGGRCPGCGAAAPRGR